MASPKRIRLPGRFAPRLLRFLRLDGPRRGLLLRAWLLLWEHRIRLWLGPFRLPEPSGVPGSPSLPVPHAPATGAHRPSPGTIGWAVSAASHLVPRSSCLVRALAAQSLCQRFGYPSELRLGARRDDAGELEAHAWLEMGEEVVIGGGQELADYSLFRPATEGARKQMDP